MKLKKLFVAAALALGLGVGAVAGISANKSVAEVNAGATKTLFLDVNNVEGITNGWESDSARTFAYCHGGTASAMSWPGQQMTKLSTGRYSLDIDSDFTNVIFCRVAPGSNTVWNRSSNDQKISINLPADLEEYNLFVLWHHGYDDGNYAGNWTNFNAYVFDEAITSAQKGLTSCEAKYNATKDKYEALSEKDLAFMKEHFLDSYNMFAVWAANQGVSIAAFSANKTESKNNLLLFVGIGSVSIVTIGALAMAKKRRHE